MSARFSLVVATIASACVNIPPFAGGDAGGNGDGAIAMCDPATATTVSAQLDGTTQMVCGPHYTMRFSNDGFRYPSSFVVAGHELLAQGATCADESGLGIGLYPAGIIDGEVPVSPESVTSQKLEVELETPFVVRVGLTWQVGLGSCSGMFNGRTSFSFFKNGRIARMDEIVQTVGGVDASACLATCTTTSPSWRVTTFSSFANTGQTLAHGTVPATLGQSDGTIPNENCISTGQYHVGLGWSEDSGGKRLRRNAQSAMAFVYDLEQGTTIGAFDHLVRTTYVVSTAGCDEPTLAAYDSLSIQLNVGRPNMTPQTTIEPSRDGIYGGSPDAIEHGLPLMNDAVELSLRGGDPSVPAAWVAWLRYTDNYTGFTIKKNGIDLGAAAEFSIRSLDHHEVLFWFADPLAAGEKITIEPHP